MIDAVEDWDLREDDSRIPSISRSEDPARIAEAVKIEDQNQESAPKG